MKNILLLIPFLCFGFSLSAQTVPQGMNYQAVARDAKGAILTNKDISLKISLLADSPDGKTLYSEIHDATTSPLGLFDLIIGQGLPEAGVFTEIPWSQAEVWMDISMDENNDGDFKSIGASKLLTVPYAFHAGTAGEVLSPDGAAKSSVYWKTFGNNATNPAYHFFGTNDYKDLNFKTNNTQRMTIGANGNIAIVNDLSVSGNVTANAFIGDGSGLTGINVNDADSDPTNELQDWSNLPGIPADIADGDQVDDADSDPTNELQHWNNLPGIPADIANGDQVNDADSDPTNELQDWSSLPGIPADIANGDQVNDADSDPTNELQDWSSLPGIPADIANGDQVNDADADPTNELQDWNSLPGIPADIANGDQVNDADSDPTNELQNWSNLPGIPSDIANGDQVNDADADPTNELELPTNAQFGNMAYFNGSSWQRISTGLNGQVLTLNNGIPTWAANSGGGDGSQLGSLLPVLLPDGVTIYVQPVDNENPILWGENNVNIPGLNEVSVTDFSELNLDLNGEANTQAIISATGSFNGGIFAANFCSNLVAYGFDDWYLPAAGELNTIYEKLGPTDNGFGGSGNITTGNYWSSTETNLISAWLQDFSHGTQSPFSKEHAQISCRCVRR